MIYGKVELHNVSEVTECDGGVTLHRFPQWVEPAFTDQGKRMNTGNTGVEIRFRMGEGPVTLRLRAAGENLTRPIYVYQGGFVRDSMDYVHYIHSDRVTEVVIKPIVDWDKLNALQAAAQLPYDPRMVRVILGNGRLDYLEVIGDCQPPRPEDKPRHTYLAYGSSITHGSTAVDPMHSFVSVTAEELGLDPRNLGMAGSCRLEPEVARYIAEEGARGGWDVATLCMGINVLGWEEDKIVERVSHMIRTVADANPEKHIFCISPLFCGSDIKGEDKGNLWRRIIEQKVREYGSPFVHYVSGLDLLDGAWGLSADRVHPSPRGIRAIAANLTAAMRPFMM